MIVRPAIRGDGVALSRVLRAEDRAEIQAIHGDIDLAEHLDSSVDLCEEVRCATLFGRPVALFGRTITHRDHDLLWAQIWMLWSAPVFDCTREVVELTRRWLPQITGNAIGWNWISAKNHALIRFLEHFGAEISEQTTTFRDPNFPFVRFTFDPSHVRSAPSAHRRSRRRPSVR